MMNDLENKFSQAFDDWFKSEEGTVDFWSESNAPDALAKRAVEIVKQELLPKLRVAAEALAALENCTQLRHARVATAALDCLNAP